MFWRIDEVRKAIASTIVFIFLPHNAPRTLIYLCEPQIRATLQLYIATLSHLLTHLHSFLSIVYICIMHLNGGVCQLDSTLVHHSITIVPAVPSTVIDFPVEMRSMA